jgi:hypothetical protein
VVEDEEQLFLGGVQIARRAPQLDVLDFSTLNTFLLDCMVGLVEWYN